MERKVQFRLNVADAFFGLLNYKNNQYGKAAAAKYFKSFNFPVSPHFANTLLYAVLVVQLVCKYAGVGEGNLFFFGSGEKREGKSSFADFGFGAGEAVCKCAFAVAVGFIVSFINLYKRM